MSQLDTQPADAPDSRPNGRVDADLPSPIEFPHADLVIFDGECVFCTAQVKNLKRFDGRNRLAFVSLHDKFVTDRFPDLSHEQMMEQIYIVPNSKTGYTDVRYGGADGVRYLTRRLPKLWIFAPPCRNITVAVRLLERP
jgi:predicted DCC family thiol-disulfide oxidoreductase YuxK